MFTFIFDSDQNYRKLIKIFYTKSAGVGLHKELVDILKKKNRL